MTKGGRREKEKEGGEESTGESKEREVRKNN